MGIIELRSYHLCHMEDHGTHTVELTGSAWGCRKGNAKKGQIRQYDEFRALTQFLYIS